MLDDEDIWAEFKTELCARNLKTSMGVQGMLSQFVLEKSQKQQQEEQGVATTMMNINGNNGGGEIRDASSNNNNLLRRLTSNLSMASFVTTEDAHQHHQAEHLLRALPGRRGSGSHTNTHEISNDNYHSRECDKSGKMGLRYSCPPERRGDNYNSGSGKRHSWSNHFLGSMMEIGESSTSSKDAVTPNAIPKKSLFKDWFGLVGDRGGEKSNNDQNEAKPTINRNEGNNQKLQPASSKKEQHDNDIVIDSGPGLDEVASYFPAPEELDTSTHQRSNDSSRDRCDRNQDDGGAQDVNTLRNAVVPLSQSSYSKPSCLKLSSREASSLPQMGSNRNNDHGQQDQGAEDLFCLLLSFDSDSGPSEERVKQVRSPPADETKVNVKNKEMEEETKKQHQTPLDPSTRKSADSLSNLLKPAGLHFKYKPRRKHASPVGNTLESTNMFSSTDNSNDIQRQRQVRTLQDNAIVNRSSSTALSTSISDDTLNQNVHSMMRTGSIRDVNKRRGNQGALLNPLNQQQQPQPSDNASWNPQANVLSTGNITRDMRQRHIPTTAERQNQDWATSNGASLNQQQLPSDNVNRQAALTGIRDQKKRHKEMQHQERAFGDTDNNNGENSISDNPMINNIDLRRRQMILKSSTMHEKEEANNGRVWGTTTASSTNQVVQEKSNDNGNTSTDMFRRYLENKARSSTATSKPASSSNDDTSPALLTNGSSGPRGSSAKNQHQGRAFDDTDNNNGENSISDNDPMIDRIDSMRRQMITQSSTMHEQEALLNPLDQQQQRQPSDNASWNPQANVLSTGNITRDMRQRRIPKHHIPTTAERQHQDLATGNGALWNQQQLPSDNVNRKAASTRIRDLMKRHKERQQQGQDFDDNYNNYGENSISDSDLMIESDSIDLRRRQMIMKSSTMHENDEANNGRVRGTTTASSSSSSQVVQEKSNDNGNTGYTGTNLFRRYLENKARRSTATSKPESSNKDDTSLTLLTNGSSGPRGSSTKNASSAGQLLVEWGDTTADDDDDDEHGNINSEMPNECIEPCIPKKKEQQEETIIWPGSFNHVVEDRYITINHNEAAFRRVSDLTTHSFDEEIDGYQEEAEELPAPLAFRRKMRSLSIAEESEEEEEEVEEVDDNDDPPPMLSSQHHPSLSSYPQPGGNDAPHGVQPTNVGDDDDDDDCNHETPQKNEHGDVDYSFFLLGHDDDDEYD